MGTVFMSAMYCLHNHVPPSRSARAEWATCYGVPAILIAVASLQLVLAHTQDLTPWKGAGFGMFSTVDAGANRRLQVVLVAGAHEMEVRPPELGGLRRELRNFPTEARLEAYGRQLAKHVWVPQRAPDSPVDRTATGEEHTAEQQFSVRDAPSLASWRKGQPIPRRVLVIDRVRVTIDRPSFDPRSGELSFERVRQVEVPGAPLDQIAAAIGVPITMLEPLP